MPVTFVSAGTEGSGSGNTVTPGTPGSAAADHIIIVVAHTSDGGAMTMTGDWTSILQGTGNGTSRVGAWWHRYDGVTMPSFTVTRSGGTTENFIAGAAIFAGCKTSGSPINVAAASVSGGNSTAPLAASITTTVNDCMIVRAFGVADDNSVSSITGLPLSVAFEDTGGGTQAAFVSTTGGVDGAVGLYYGLQSYKGATGTAGNAMGAADPWTTFLFALEPITISGAAEAETFKEQANSDTTTITFSNAGIADGSMIHFFFKVSGGQEWSTTPSGYVEKSRAEISGTLRLEHGTLRVSGSPPTLTFQTSSSGFKGGIMLSYTNPGTSGDAINGTTTNTGSGTTATATGVTTTKTNCMLIVAILGDNGGAKSLPTGMNLRVHQNGGGGVTGWDEMQAAAAATGNRVSTITSAPWAAILVAMESANSSGGAALVQVVDETVEIDETSNESIITQLVQVVNETVNISESTVNRESLKRVVNETINLNESIAHSESLKRVVNESVNLSETVARFETLVKRVDETVQLSESTPHLESRVKLVNETVQLSEAIVDVLGGPTLVLQAVDEDVHISETVVAVIGGPVLTIQAVDEDVHISESIGHATALKRVVNETLQISETVPHHEVLLRRINETIQLSETSLGVLAGIGAALVQVVDEAVEISEDLHGVTMKLPPYYALIFVMKAGS